MSASSMFSSPSKTAQSGSQQTTANDENTISTLLPAIENYTNSENTQLRDAIGNQQNPYFSGASSMSPSAYNISDATTQSFSAPNAQQAAQSGAFGPNAMPSTTASSSPTSGSPSGSTGSPSQSSSPQYAQLGAMLTNALATVPATGGQAGVVSSLPGTRSVT